MAVDLRSPFKPVLLNILFLGRCECSRFEEVGEQILPVPSLVTKSLPRVVICSGTSSMRHTVDNRASSYSTANAYISRAIRKMRLRSRRERPSPRRLVFRDREARDRSIERSGLLAVFDDKNGFCQDVQLVQRY